MATPDPESFRFLSKMYGTISNFLHEAFRKLNIIVPQGGGRIADIFRSTDRNFSFGAIIFAFYSNTFFVINCLKFNYSDWVLDSKPKMWFFSWIWKHFRNTSLEWRIFELIETQNWWTWAIEVPKPRPNFLDIYESFWDSQNTNFRIFPLDWKKTNSFIILTLVFAFQRQNVEWK